MFEIGLAPGENVFGYGYSSERLAGGSGAEELIGGRIRNHDTEVEVAVGPAIAAGCGAEEIDSDWVVEIDQPPRDFLDRCVWRYHYPIFSLFE